MATQTIKTTLDYVQASSASPSEASPGGDEFKNFESLAAKLVQVPKSELDEQRQKS